MKLRHLKKRNHRDLKKAANQRLFAANRRFITKMAVHIYHVSPLMAKLMARPA